MASVKQSAEYTGNVRFLRAAAATLRDDFSIDAGRQLLSKFSTDTTALLIH